jgi:hypothetical protein
MFKGFLKPWIRLCEPLNWPILLELIEEILGIISIAAIFITIAMIIYLLISKKS